MVQARLVYIIILPAYRRRKSLINLFLFTSFTTLHNLPLLRPLKRDRDTCPLSKLACKRKLCTVACQDVFYDGKSKSGSAALARTALVNAVEALEYALLMLLADAYSVILDSELNLAVECVADIDNHISALILVIVADGVVTQIVEHLIHHRLVGVYIGRGSKEHQLNIVLRGGDIKVLHAVLRRLV